MKLQDIGIYTLCDDARDLQLNYARQQIDVEKEKNSELKILLDRAEEISGMWKKDLQKYSQQYQGAESRLRAEVAHNTEMQRKHKAEMRTEKNLAHAKGWAGGFKAAKVMNTRGVFEEIKQMHKSELREVEKALKAQYTRLRREDPFVYMVKLSRSDGTTAYMTQSPTHGFYQFFARDLENLNLRLFSSRKDAKSVCESLSSQAGNTYEVVEMPKRHIYSLPCYTFYHNYEAFQPLEHSND